MSELDLSLRLKADASGLVGTVRVSKRELDKLTNSTDKSGKGMKRLSTGTDRADKSARALNRSSKNLSRRLISLRGVLATLGVGLVSRSFIQAASTSEQYRIRLKVLLGSMDEGNRLFKEMADFAGRVPFEFEQIMGSATQLAGVMRGGVDEITQWIPLIGDLAAASGLSIDVTTQQVIRMLSAGAGAADLFRERGVLAMLNFQAGATTSAEETRKKLMDEWTKANSQFRGATGGLASTWVGAMSMLSDKWFQFRNNVMDAGLFDWLKSLVNTIDSDLGGAIDDSKDKAKGWSDFIISTIKSIAIGTAGIIDVLAEPMRMIGNVAANIWNGFKTLPSWVQEVGILGALFLGTKGRLAILGVLAAADQLDIRKFEAVVTADQFVKGTEEELRAKLANVQQMIAISQEKQLRSWWDFRNALPDPTEIMPSLENLKRIELQIIVGLSNIGASVENLPDLPSIPDTLFGEGGTGSISSWEAAMKKFFAAVDSGATKAGNSVGGLGKKANGAGKETGQMTKQQQDFMKSLKEEARLLKFTGKELEIQIALGRAHELGIKDQDKAIREMVGSMYDLERAQEATAASAKASNRVVDRIYKDTATSIRQSFRDTFRQVFDDGIDGFKGLADKIKNIFKDLLADLLTLAASRKIIIPIVTSIGGSLGISQTAIASVTQQLGGGAAGNAGATSIPGTQGLIGKAATSFGGYGGAALGALGGAYLGYQNNGTRGAVVGGVAGYAGGAALTAGGAFLAAGGGAAGALGAAGAGFAGALAAIPVWGWAALAALAVFGGGKSKSKIRLGSARDLEEAARLGFNNKETSPFGVIGITSDSNKFGGGRGRGVTRAAKSIDEGIAALLSDAEIERVRAALDGTTTRRISRTTFEKSDAASLVRERLITIIDAIAENTVASKQLSGTKNIGKLAQESQQLIGEISAFRAAMGKVEPINAAEQALKALNNQFDQLSATAEKLGFSIDDVEQRRQQEIEQLGIDFDKSIRDQILAIENPFTLMLENQQRQAEERLSNAQTLGRDLTEVERLNALERQGIIDQQLELERQANREREQLLESFLSSASSLGDTIKRITRENLSPTQQLSSLRADFESLASEALTLSGGELVSSAANLNGLVSGLLSSGRSTFASGPEFQALLQRVLALLVSVQDRLSDEGSARSGDLNLTVVTTDGQELKAEVFQGLLDRSEQGEIVVDARGVAS